MLLFRISRLPSCDIKISQFQRKPASDPEEYHFTIQFNPSPTYGNPVSQQWPFSSVKPGFLMAFPCRSWFRCFSLHSAGYFSICCAKFKNMAALNRRLLLQVKFISVIGALENDKPARKKPLILGVTNLSGGSFYHLGSDNCAAP